MIGLGAVIRCRLGVQSKGNSLSLKRIIFHFNITEISKLPLSPGSLGSATKHNLIALNYWLARF